MWQVETMASHSHKIENPMTAADSRGVSAEPVSAEVGASVRDRAGDSEPTDTQAGMRIPTTSGEAALNERAAEAPKLYLPACGALCDILWWARRGS